MRNRLQDTKWWQPSDYQNGDFWQGVQGNCILEGKIMFSHLRISFKHIHKLPFVGFI